MKKLEYKLIQDRFKKPLVMLESPLGNGQEISPDSLRELANQLLKIANEAEERPMIKGYYPASKETSY